MQEVDHRPIDRKDDINQADGPDRGSHEGDALLNPPSPDIFDDHAIISAENREEEGDENCLSMGVMRGETEGAALLASRSYDEAPSSDHDQEVSATGDLDPALSGKMHLVNNPPFERGLTVALYSGLLLGALFWGLTADIMGRRIAFNTSLIFCSVFAIAAGAAPNFNVLALLVALSAFGGGGNLILDTTVFLEYLPSRYQWVLTLLAAWWSLGEMVAALVSWPLMAHFSCENGPGCDKADNMGWRYVWYVLGTLVFVMSMLRFFVIHLKETPKYLLGQGKDGEVVETLQYIAKEYGRHCSLDADQLRRCGRLRSNKMQKSVWMGELRSHLQGLFLTREIARSTLLIWSSWILIGLAYPLYNVFLPEYLASRGARLGDGSINTTYRNFSIITVCGIWGPILAGFLCEVSFLGRRGTMVIGALTTMVFLFAYTQVRTPGQNLGFNCAITFCLNIYYGCLYAYTPEVLPSAHRATGNGIAVAFNRLMGIVSALVATVADTLHRYGDRGGSVPARALRPTKRLNNDEYPGS
ncbi:MAG: hypothetical protein M4579_001011 [Chaenotheca gracillima]|nr:MAG: hypothetical protein M4579_001011 [Chaenotheca gracillima]